MDGKAFLSFSIIREHANKPTKKGRRRSPPPREDDVTRRCQPWKRRRTRATKRATRSRFFLPRRRRLSPSKSRRRRNPSCKAPISPRRPRRRAPAAARRFRGRGGVYIALRRRCSRSCACRKIGGGVDDVAVGFAGIDLVRARARSFAASRRRVLRLSIGTSRGRSPRLSNFASTFLLSFPSLVTLQRPRPGAIGLDPLCLQQARRAALVHCLSPVDVNFSSTRLSSAASASNAFVLPFSSCSNPLANDSAFCARGCARRATPLPTPPIIFGSLYTALR